MKLALLIVGDGRFEYLQETAGAVRDQVLHPITARVMANDEADDAYCRILDGLYPEWDIVHTGRAGMAGAVQAGWAKALEYDPDYLFHLEEDMLITRRLPIGPAIGVLETHPDLAQMCFKREPFDPSEGDDQLAAICRLAPNSGMKASYTWHDYLFSSNPCLIPKRVLEMGWPSGPIGVGNEDGMTRRLLDAGYLFGSWGHVGDPPFARHIGAARSAQWAL